jgi:hypothetical protein
MKLTKDLKVQEINDSLSLKSEYFDRKVNIKSIIYSNKIKNIDNI